MLAGVFAGFILAILMLISVSPLILSGNISETEQRMEDAAILRNHLAECLERERLLGEELKKYTAMAKGDCKACMVARGIVASERELEIEVER